MEEVLTSKIQYFWDTLHYRIFVNKFNFKATPIEIIRWTQMCFLLRIVLRYSFWKITNLITMITITVMEHTLALKLKRFWEDLNVLERSFFNNISLTKKLFFLRILKNVSTVCTFWVFYCCEIEMIFIYIVCQ